MPSLASSNTVDTQQLYRPGRRKEEKNKKEQVKKKKRKKAFIHHVSSLPLEFLCPIISYETHWVGFITIPQCVE